ncbi:MAG: hypothetical protein PHC39_02460 [Proteiniphilum sp.]|nr:hypothetical protein [Proteiniphilum sp.]
MVFIAKSPQQLNPGEFVFCSLLAVNIPDKLPFSYSVYYPSPPEIFSIASEPKQI